MYWKNSDGIWFVKRVREGGCWIEIFVSGEKKPYCIWPDIRKFDFKELYKRMTYAMVRCSVMDEKTLLCDEFWNADLVSMVVYD